MLTEEQATLLPVTVDQPALRLIRTIFDSKGVASEAACALIRGDRCQLLFELWADMRAATRSPDRMVIAAPIRVAPGRRWQRPQG